MRVALIIASAMLIILPAAAQDPEWVRYEGGFDMRDGIYFDFDAFRHNKPSVPLERLQDSQGVPVQDIRRLSGKAQWVDDAGEKRVIDMFRIWGFCNNDVVYLRAGNGFYRIGLMGSLSHVLYEYTYRDWDPYMYGFGTMDRTVMAQKLLDMRTGNFLPFNAGGMDAALAHDAILLEEWRALGRKQRNRPETQFLFLRRYNDRHPLYFPR